MKKIISIAVIMALPFTANADPTPVPSNGTPVVASANPPYQTVGITPSTDGAHIASTAYVKGAYNDAIAAVNKLNDSVNSALANKQAKLSSTGDGGDIISDVFDYSTYDQAANDMILFGDADNILVSVDALHGAVEAAKDEIYQEIDQDLSEKQDILEPDNNHALTTSVVSNFSANDAADVVTGTTAYAEDIASQYSRGSSEESLISVRGAVDLVRGASQAILSDVNDKRVTARDTWGSNHEAQVQLSSVQ